MNLDEGDCSSIATALSKERRQYYTLRAAIDEKFVSRPSKKDFLRDAVSVPASPRSDLDLLGAALALR